MTATITITMPPARRLWRLSALLLLTLLLATGVSLSMTPPFAARQAEVTELVLPSMRLVHEIGAAVDEVRGLSALHLLRADPADVQALEANVQALRRRIDRRMAASRLRLADDAERGLYQHVADGLAAFWVAQDRLLAAMCRAAVEPAAAVQARALLAGESQQAFQRLRTELDAWWAYTDRLADRVLRRDASQARARLLLLGLQGLMALALVGCLLAARQVGRATARRGAAAAGAAGQARLLSLNAAVLAARDGAVGDASLAVSQEVRQIADRLQTTATELQVLADLHRPPPDGAGR